jgi:hypothetical protein
MRPETKDYGTRTSASWVRPGQAAAFGCLPWVSAQPGSAVLVVLRTGCAVGAGASAKVSSSVSLQVGWTTFSGADLESRFERGQNVTQPIDSQFQFQSSTSPLREVCAPTGMGIAGDFRGGKGKEGEGTGTTDHGPRTTDLGDKGPRTTDHGPRTTDLGTRDHGQRTTDLGDKGPRTTDHDDGQRTTDLGTRDHDNGQRTTGPGEGGFFVLLCF